MPTTTHQYKKLKIWQDSVTFSVAIYTLTKSFISEGSNRGTKKDFVSFLRIALGSAAEVETQLLIANRLTFIKDTEYLELNKSLEQIMGMIDSFIKTISKA